MTENPYQSPAYISSQSRTNSPFGNPVTARGQLKPHDLRLFARLVSAPNRREVVFWLLVLGGLLGVLFCLVYWDPRRSTPQVTMSKTEITSQLLALGATLGLSTITIIGSLYLFRSREEQTCSAKQGIFAEQAVRINAEGVEFAYDGIRSVIPWTSVRWSRHNGAILALQTNGPLMWWALPRRWFDQDEQWNQVVEFVEHRLAAPHENDHITLIVSEG